VSGLSAVDETIRMPPGPRLPRFMQTLGFIFVTRRFVDGCRRRYGDAVTFSTLFDPCFVMVLEPSLLKQVFRGSPEQLRAGEANAPLGPVVGERSVLLLDGAEHLRHRRLMLPSFHGERMRAYESVMTEAADRTIDGWPVGREFRLLPSTQSLTLDVIMRAVFGVEAGLRQEELKRRVRAVIEPVGSRLGMLTMLLTGGRLGRTQNSIQLLVELAETLQCPVQGGNFPSRHPLAGVRGERVVDRLGRADPPGTCLLTTRGPPRGTTAYARVRRRGITAP